jgi:hypothetical protein
MSNNAEYQLRFKFDQIKDYSLQYEYRSDEMIERLVPSVKDAGHLTKEQLLEVGHWKSPRITRHLKSNSDELVRETTRIALQSTVEELRICVPQVLAGVSWPMASVILHFFHEDKYPILDFRALWSLGIPQPYAYTTALWMRYVDTCRAISAKVNVDMRTLDRALWQYSKEHQSKKSL